VGPGTARPARCRSLRDRLPEYLGQRYPPTPGLILQYQEIVHVGRQGCTAIHISGVGGEQLEGSAGDRTHGTEVPLIEGQ
jgi:hypothetical protein